MTKARTFKKSEILDAARAAAETGLSACLHPSGEIEFTHGPSQGIKRQRRKAGKPASPEAMLEGWLNESEAGGHS